MVGELTSVGDVVTSVVQFVFAWAGDTSDLPQPHIQLALALAPGIEQVVSNALGGGCEEMPASLASVELHERLAFGNGGAADDRALMYYWHPGRAAAETVRNLAFSVDKSRVFDVGLFCGAALRSDGFAWWMVPQVASDGVSRGLDPRRNLGSAEGLDMSIVDF